MTDTATTAHTTWQAQCPICDWGWVFHAPKGTEQYVDAAMKDKLTEHVRTHVDAEGREL